MGTGNRWRISVEECHVLFTACSAQQTNPSLRSRPGFENLLTWREAFYTTTPLVVDPTENDETFFPTLVEQEILRLAAFESNGFLPCECLVMQHRRILQRFRIKNLSP